MVHWDLLDDVLRQLPQQDVEVLTASVRPQIKDVIFNCPATIVKWSDGTKTVVKCKNGDQFDEEKGLALAIAKKYYGNTQGWYRRKMSQWIEKSEKKQEKPKKKRSIVVSSDIDVNSLKKLLGLPY